MSDVAHRLTDSELEAFTRSPSASPGLTTFRYGRAIAGRSPMQRADAPGLGADRRGRRARDRGSPSATSTGPRRSDSQR